MSPIAIGIIALSGLSIIPKSYLVGGDRCLT